MHNELRDIAENVGPMQDIGLVEFLFRIADHLAVLDGGNSCYCESKEITKDFPALPGKRLPFTLREVVLKGEGSTYDIFDENTYRRYADYIEECTLEEDGPMPEGMEDFSGFECLEEGWWAATPTGDDLKKYFKILLDK